MDRLISLFTIYRRLHPGLNAADLLPRRAVLLGSPPSPRGQTLAVVHVAAAKEAGTPRGRVIPTALL